MAWRRSPLPTNTHRSMYDIPVRLDTPASATTYTRTGMPRPPVRSDPNIVPLVTMPPANDLGLDDRSSVAHHQAQPGVQRSFARLLLGRQMRQDRRSGVSPAAKGQKPGERSSAVAGPQHPRSHFTVRSRLAPVLDAERPRRGFWSNSASTSSHSSPCATWSAGCNFP